MPAVPVLSTEATLARVLLIAGAVMAGFVGLLMMGLFLVFIAQVGRLPGGPEIWFPWSVFSFFFLLSVVGVFVNIFAARHLPRDVRRAGILGVVAAFLPATNLFSLAGGIVALVSPEAKAQGRPTEQEVAREDPAQ
jgi:energy-coupling factor transporter transmembrane protein EcfT